MKRYIAIAIALLILGAAVALLLTGGPGGSVASNGNTGGPVIVIEDVRAVSEEGGTIRWIAESERVEYEDSSGIARFGALRAESPAEHLIVNSDGGSYDVKARRIALAGNVVAHKDEYTFRTGAMTYDLSAKALEADGAVEVEGKGMKATGRGLRAWGDKIEVRADVRTVVR